MPAAGSMPGGGGSRFSCNPLQAACQAVAPREECLFLEPGGRESGGPRFPDAVRGEELLCYVVGKRRSALAAEEEATKLSLTACSLDTGAGCV